METKDSDTLPRAQKGRIKRWLVRGLTGLTVVSLGLGAMVYFSGLKKKPGKTHPKEMVLQVSVSPAVPETVQTRLKGFGVAAPVTIVRLSAEVGGRIIQVHPNFRTGKIIARGEVIFKIDPLDYQAALDNARAQLAQKEVALARIEKEYQGDKNRLGGIARTMALARAEYDRVRVLLEENSIGNRSAVDQAEQAMNAAIDSHEQMKRTLSLYPVQRQDALAAIASARADLEKARTNLARCTVTAPFTGRIKSRSMELGEYAAAGKEVVTLADDSQLEILVSLDAREVSAWLAFEETPPEKAGGWFPRPVGVDCDIQWIEAKTHTWKGRLSRLVAFDQESRTMTLAVVFDPSANLCQGCPPLVEGMFCSVSIPGKPVADLFRVKRWLVTTDNTLYVAEGSRLATRRVERVYAEGDWLFVTGEIAQGDRIITTRLVDPLEGAALNITAQD